MLVHRGTIGRDMGELAEQFVHLAGGLQEEEEVGEDGGLIARAMGMQDAKCVAPAVLS